MYGSGLACPVMPKKRNWASKGCPGTRVPMGSHEFRSGGRIGSQGVLHAHQLLPLVP
jgi:hypothetical protein